MGEHDCVENYCVFMMRDSSHIMILYAPQTLQVLYYFYYVYLSSTPRDMIGGGKTHWDLYLCCLLSDFLLL